MNDDKYYKIVLLILWHIDAICGRQGENVPFLSSSDRVVNLTKFWCSMKISKHAPDISWSRLFLCKKWSYCTRISERCQQSCGQTGLAMVLQQTTSVVCVRHQAESKIFSEIDKILTKQISRKTFGWFLFEGVYASKQILNSAGNIMIVPVCVCVCGSVTGKALGTQLSVEAFGKKQTSNVVLVCLGIFLVHCSTCIWKTTGKNKDWLAEEAFEVFEAHLDTSSLNHTESKQKWPCWAGTYAENIGLRYFTIYLILFYDVCSPHEEDDNTRDSTCSSCFRFVCAWSCHLCNLWRKRTIGHIYATCHAFNPFARSNVRNCS